MHKPDSGQIIQLFNRGYTAKQITKETGSSRTVVYRELAKHGLRYEYQGRLSLELTTAIIADYKLGMSSNKIATKTNIDCKRIRRLLERNQVARRSYSEIRKYQLDQTFFDVIDTESKAYWLGFILADGWITATGRTKQSKRLSIGLQHRDIKHLESMKQSLNTNIILKQRLNKLNGKIFISDVLVINSKHLGIALEDKGWWEFKQRGITTIYNYVPQTLLRHFIRGLIDGDGSVGLRPHNPNRKLTPFVFYCDIHRDAVAKFLDVICQNCGIKCNKIYERVNKKLASINYSGIDATKIINWAYTDCTIALDRKWQTAREIIKMSAHQSVARIQPQTLS